MKRIIIISACMAAAAMTLVSCQKNLRAEKPTDEKGLVHFIISTAQDQTKTFLDKSSSTYISKWSNGDQIGVFFATTTISGETKALEGTFINESADGPEATFTGTTIAEGSGSFYSFYPASCFEKGYADGTIGLNTGVASDYYQQPRQDNIDPDYDIMVAQQGTYTVSGDPATATVSGLRFARLLSVLKINLTSEFADVQGEKVTSFKLTAPTETTLSGRLKYKPSTMEVTGWTSSKNYILARYQTGNEPLINDIDHKSVFLLVNPAEIAIGSDVTINIETENYFIEKTISIAGKALSFPQGKMAVLNLSIAEANCSAKATTKTLPYEESFAGTFGSFSVENKTLPSGFTNIWTANSGYAKATAYASLTAYESEALLISPKINTAGASGVVLSFDHALNYLNDGTASNHIHLCVREYTGDSAGEWNDVAISTYPSGNSFTFVRNTADLYNYLGKTIQIAFRYKSTSSCAPTWEIKNVSVAVPVTTIEFEKSSLTISVGNSADNPATSNSSGTITYSSSDESIATVDEDGKINAVAKGTCTITATVAAKDSYPGKSTTCSVTVSDIPAPIILDFSGKKSGASAYSGSWTYDNNWTITNGANNNKGWGYVKMGGKSTTLATANPCTIKYNNKVTDTISEVTVSITAGSLSKSGMSVNSWGVYVYSDAVMTTQIDYVAGGSITNAAATFSFTPSTGKTWKDCYVKVSWDLANTTTINGIVCVDKITVSF